MNYASLTLFDVSLLLAVSASRRQKGGPVSTTDRVSVFLELAEAYRETGSEVSLFN